MSSEAINLAYEECRRVRAGTPRFVLLLLALHHYPRSGQCNPSIGRMVEITGYKNDAIKRALRHLRRSRVIALSARGRGTGNSNHYVFPNLVTVNGDAGPCKSRSYGSSASPKTGVNGAHEPGYGGSEAPRIRKKKSSEDIVSFAPEKLPLPHGEQFAAAWRDFCKHRREVRHALTPTATNRILLELGSVPESEAVRATNEAIARGWRKPFPRESGNISPAFSQKVRQLVL
jgi:hypothetical protein